MEAKVFRELLDSHAAGQAAASCGGLFERDFCETAGFDLYVDGVVMVLILEGGQAGNAVDSPRLGGQRHDAVEIIVLLAVGQVG